MEIQDTITSLYNRYFNDLSGHIAQSIPELSNVNPDLFAISVATVDGDVFHIGDHDHEFTIQSISKPFTYALALEQNGLPLVESKVGMEPTGEDFDSIIKVDDTGRPFNPMVNSGAVATTSLISPGQIQNREKQLLSYYSRFAGRELSIDQKTYHSEADTGHKNWAIAHLLRHFKILTKNFQSDVDLYFKQCSVKVTSDDLAIMGATLANRGINPKTQEPCISKEHLRHVLSILLTCGMYNYSGEWVFDVGLPAKSGISGGILMVVPGKMGIAIYSPRLDKRHNSVRAIKVCEDLSTLHKLHILDF